MSSHAVTTLQRELVRKQARMEALLEDKPRKRRKRARHSRRSSGFGGDSRDTTAVSVAGTNTPAFSTPVRAANDVEVQRRTEASAKASSSNSPMRGTGVNARAQGESNEAVAARLYTPSASRAVNAAPRSQDVRDADVSSGASTHLQQRTDATKAMPPKQARGATQGSPIVRSNGSQAGVMDTFEQIQDASAELETHLNWARSNQLAADLEESRRVAAVLETGPSAADGMTRVVEMERITQTAANERPNPMFSQLNRHFELDRRQFASQVSDLDLLNQTLPGSQASADRVTSSRSETIADPSTGERSSGRRARASTPHPGPLSSQSASDPIVTSSFDVKQLRAESIDSDAPADASDEDDMVLTNELASRRVEVAEASTSAARVQEAMHMPPQRVLTTTMASATTGSPGRRRPRPRIARSGSEDFDRGTEPIQPVEDYWERLLQESSFAERRGGRATSESDSSLEATLAVARAAARRPSTTDQSDSSVARSQDSGSRRGLSSTPTRTDSTDSEISSSPASFLQGNLLSPSLSAADSAMDADARQGDQPLSPPGQQAGATRADVDLRAGPSLFRGNSSDPYTAMDISTRAVVVKKERRDEGMSLFRGGAGELGPSQMTADRHPAVSQASMDELEDRMERESLDLGLRSIPATAFTSTSTQSAITREEETSRSAALTSSGDVYKPPSSAESDESVERESAPQRTSNRKTRSPIVQQALSARRPNTPPRPALTRLVPADPPSSFTSSTLPPPSLPTSLPTPLPHWTPSRLRPHRQAAQRTTQALHRLYQVSSAAEEDGAPGLRAASFAIQSNDAREHSRMPERFADADELMRVQLLFRSICDSVSYIDDHMSSLEEWARLAERGVDEDLKPGFRQEVNTVMKTIKESAVQAYRDNRDSLAAVQKMRRDQVEMMMNNGILEANAAAKRLKTLSDTNWGLYKRIKKGLAQVSATPAREQETQSTPDSDESDDATDDEGDAADDEDDATDSQATDDSHEADDEADVEAQVRPAAPSPRKDVRRPITPVDERDASDPQTARVAHNVGPPPTTRPLAQRRSASTVGVRPEVVPRQASTSSRSSSRLQQPSRQASTSSQPTPRLSLTRGTEDDVDRARSATATTTSEAQAQRRSVEREADGPVVLPTVQRARTARVLPKVFSTQSGKKPSQVAPRAVSIHTPYTAQDKVNILEHLAVSKRPWNGKLIAQEMEERYGRHPWMSYNTHLRDNLVRGKNYTDQVLELKRQLGHDGLRALRAKMLEALPNTLRGESDEEPSWAPKAKVIKMYPLGDGGGSPSHSVASHVSNELEYEMEYTSEEE